MREIPEVELPPINGRVIKVGLINDEYNIGGSRKGRNVVPVYDGRVVEYITEMAKKRVLHKFDARVLISGPVRTGKSTVAVDVARKLNPKFTADQVAFRLEDFTDILAELPPADPKNGKYPVAIYDEAGTGLYSKDFQMKLVKQMAKIFQIIGKKNLTMIMCLPHRNLLTRDVREQMHIWINTRTDLEGERGFAELREGIENIWQLELYWKPICGFCFDECTDDFWTSYEIHKDKFIQDFTKGKVDAPTRVSDAIYQRNKAIKLAASRQRKTLKEMSEILDLNPGAISDIINDKK